MKENIKFDVRPDGVYAILDNSVEEAKPTRKQLLEMIDEYKISQIDANAVNEILKSSEQRPVMKISDQTNLSQKHEGIVIDVSKDRMAVAINFTPPEFGGGFITVDKILAELKSAGISFGINEGQIESLMQTKESRGYVKSYTVAEGKTPIDGVDGEIIYNFNTENEENHPKILPDGTVDYKQIDYFISVKAGAIVATRTEPAEGESGTDVYSKPVNQKPGKPAPKFSKGKNLYISDDGFDLVAQKSGQLIINGKTLSVSPVLEIKGDVGYETGNINFDGSVNVKGAVVSGFSVNAQGNIEVKGIVEAASLTAVGSINLYGGIQGRFKGRIEAGGDVFTKFAQNARIKCGGNVVSNALLHCNVTCGGSILLDGDNCFIAGGTAEAADEIRAKTIGSHMGTRTEIKVGGNPEISGRLDEVRDEYEDLVFKYKKLSEDYEKVVQMGDVTQLDIKSKSLLLGLISHRTSVKEHAQQLEAELADLVGILRKVKGRIVADIVIHHGVNVTIANSTLALHDDITSCVLRNVNGAIKIEANLGII